MKRKIAVVLVMSLVAGVSVLGCSSGSGSSAETITIKAAMGGGMKPYAFVGADDEPTGYDIEVLKEVFNRLPQYDLTIEVTDFSSIFSGLTSGSYQIGVNNFSYNDERGASYLYSYPYDKIGYVFVTREGEPPVTSFADAAGKDFEGMPGVSVTNAVEIWNQENPDQTINISYSESDTAVKLQRIEDGSADLGIIDIAMYNAYQDEYDYALQAAVIPEEEVEMIADNSYAYYILPMDQSGLRDELNEVLKEMQEDGTLTELSTKWFGQDTAPEADKFKETIN